MSLRPFFFVLIPLFFSAQASALVCKNEQAPWTELEITFLDSSIPLFQVRATNESHAADQGALADLTHHRSLRSAGRTFVNYSGPLFGATKQESIALFLSSDQSALLLFIEGELYGYRCQE